MSRSMKNMKRKAKFDLADIPQADDDLDSVSVDHDGFKHATPKAALVDIDGEDCWIPRQFIVEMTEDTMVVAEWIAKKEGWV